MQATTEQALRAYDWDDTIQDVQDVTENTVLPEGVYPFTVTSMIRAIHNGTEKIPAGTKKAVVLVSAGAPGVGYATIKKEFYLYTSTMGFIGQFFTSLGLRKHGDPVNATMFNTVTGRSGYCALGLREYKKKDGSAAIANELKTYLEPTDGKARYEAQAAALRPTAPPAHTTAPVASAPDIPPWATGDDDAPF